MTALGLDYASVDGGGPPKFRKAYDAGVRFVIIRGAYGNWIDPTLRRDWDAAGEAGLVRGAYLYLRYPRNGSTPPPQPGAQAQALLRAIAALGPRTPLDLPPSLDIEFPGDGRKETGMSAGQALEWTRIAWRHLRDGCGVAPIIYTSARVWRDDLDNMPASDLTESPLWCARYPYRTRISAQIVQATVASLAWPPVPPPWGDASNMWIHQYQGDALEMPGFSATVDINRFRSMTVGAIGDRVRWVQRRMGRVETGVFDEDLGKVVREYQRLSGLGVDGVIGPRTFAQLCWSGLERV